MQESRNNCFGSKNRSTILLQAIIVKHQGRNVTATYNQPTRIQCPAFSENTGKCRKFSADYSCFQVTRLKKKCLETLLFFEIFLQLSMFYKRINSFDASKHSSKNPALLNTTFRIVFNFNTGILDFLSYTYHY